VKVDEIRINFNITSDSFPPILGLKEYQRHCVTYLIHNDKQIYVGETSHLINRFKDHVKSKKSFKLIKTEIITSEYFNKSAVYDLESRLINYIFADNQLELLNVKKAQASHIYFLKEKINGELFNSIWKTLLAKKIAKNDIHTLENRHLFKYSPFKELSEQQDSVVEKTIELVSKESKEDIAFDGSLTMSREFITPGNKILISGRPGTGKTLLIVKLVHELTKRYNINPREIAVCIPQSNLNKTFKIMFKQAKLKVRILRPVDIAKCEDKEIKLLIVDEAHRLKRFFSKQAKDLKHLENGKTTELEIILKKSVSTVLMFDEKQTVRPADVTQEGFLKIKNLIKLELSEQFRIKKGSDYILFIEGLLLLRDQKPHTIDFGEYKFEIVDSLSELHKIISEKNSKYGLARLISGYYQKWISQKNSSLYDFENEGIKLKWNTTITGWVHSSNAINEIGCIHTIQGEDLTYAGVVIGDDLYFDPKDKKIKVKKENYFDANGSPIIKEDLSNEQLLEYVKNVYYVLLTRGMFGTYVYIKDPELKKLFHNFINKR
jgi:DUF2075 family protein